MGKTTKWTTQHCSFHNSHHICISEYMITLLYSNYTQYIASLFDSGFCSNISCPSAFFWKSLSSPYNLCSRFLQVFTSKCAHSIWNRNTLLLGGMREISIYLSKRICLLTNLAVQFHVEFFSHLNILSIHIFISDDTHDISPRV